MEREDLPDCSDKRCYAGEDPHKHCVECTGVLDDSEDRITCKRCRAINEDPL